MGFSKIEMLDFFEQWIQREADVTVDLVKDKLHEALRTVDFDWVDLALKTKFVYNANDAIVESFDVDSLLIFTDSFHWKDVVKQDAVLAIDQLDEIKEQFRDIGVQHFSDIHELIEHSEFEWLPFEVKHAYKSSFGLLLYSNEDIVFYLKKMLWEYLYPNSFNLDRLDAIKEEVSSILQSQEINEGWMDMSEVLESIKDCFSGIDLYELSKVDWSENIEHKKHYRNPFTLGFKRIAPDRLTTEQQYS